MKILVYGAGAVGGYLGGRLARSGHDVTLITRQYTADTINKSGLSITEAGQTFIARPKAVASVAQAFMDAENNYDLIIMSMKAYDLVSSLDPLVAFCPQPPIIITFQNGIGVEQPLIDQYGAEHIIAGTLTTPIQKETLTSLVASRHNRGLGVAPTQPGQNVKRWRDLFQTAGIKSINVADYRAMKWSKALLNIIGNATSAILNRTPGVIYKSPVLFELEVRMLREALAVMDSLKMSVVDLPGAPASRLAAGVSRMPQMLLKPLMTSLVTKGRGGKMPSFQIDLASGKGKCEVEYHNGAIAKAGQAQGIATPVNQVLNDLLVKLAGEELDWRDYDGKPQLLLQEIKKYETGP